MNNIEMKIPPRDQIQEGSVKFLRDSLYHQHQAFLALEHKNNAIMLKTYCLKPEFNAVPSQVTQNTIQNGLHLYVYTNMR